MAEKTPEGKNVITVDLGTPNSEPQWRFFLSTVKYTCYGGARGGGKSWAIIRKALLLAFYYAEIQILVVRREYDQPGRDAAEAPDRPCGRRWNGDSGPAGCGMQFYPF